MPSHVPKSIDLSFSLPTIWKLTWPQLMVMLCFFSVGICDVWTAGKLGNNIQAAFGTATQANMFLQVIGMGLGSGCMAAISQAVGAGRMVRTVRYVAMALLLSASSGIVLAVLAYGGRHAFFAFLQTPQDILPITLSYWNIVLCTLPLGYVFTTSSTLFRATRQVIPPVFVAVCMATGNVIGNLGFGLGYFGLPAFGYEGIAWTTFTCTGLGALANVLVLAHRHYFDYKHFPPLRWMRVAMRYILKVGLPAGASQFVWQTGYLALFSVTASLPFDKVHAISGLAAGMRLEAMLFLPGMAFSMTASVLVGNSLGAKNPEQAQRVARLICAVGAVCMSLVALILWPYIPDMARFLSDDVITQRITQEYLHINFFATPFTLMSMILGGVMTGAGATRYNLLVFGSAFWLVRLPVAWVLGHFIWQNASGIFVGMLVSQVVQAACMLMILEYAPWKNFAQYKQKTA